MEWELCLLLMECLKRDEPGPGAARLSGLSPERWQAFLALKLAGELAGTVVPTDILERPRPAEMTEAVLSTARAQVFADKSLAVSIPALFAELLESGRPISELATRIMK